MYLSRTSRKNKGLYLCASAPLRLCGKGFENLLKNCKALSHKGLTQLSRAIVGIANHLALDYPHPCRLRT